MMEFVWVFNGQGANFPSGVFSSVENAEIWIKKHSLSGLLTQYPLDAGTYEWAIEHQYFTVKKPHQTESAFIGQFSGGQEHWHYEDGNRC